jgi:Ala-tRNA(Pro) deacylase
MISDRLKEMLDEQHVKYEVIRHPVAYTAQEEAAVTHVPGAQWAKTVVVLTDGEPVLAVLPAHRRIDLRRFQQVTGAGEVHLADEKQFRDLYPDCELGAIPPFGNLYGQTTFVDEEMRTEEAIVFHAGDHETAIRMAYPDFENLAEPVPEMFATDDLE